MTSPFLPRRQSTRNNYRDPPTFPHYARRIFRLQFRRLESLFPSRIRRKLRLGQDWRGLFTFPNLLTLFWIVILYRGERTALKRTVDSCDWSQWESWSSDANPHHLVFIADPQLVDPHTYPGRPWPVSTITVFLTDLYIRRAFSRIQKVLHPDSVILLGDLFDGGREWSTETSRNPDQQWASWGQEYWLREYERFGKVFMQHWNDGGSIAKPGHPGRKLLSGLPGNHDLGFATGVHIPVRDRFNAYFGDGNRVDVIGNHTFVSLDTVSLSAAAGDQAQEHVEIWKPTMEFLEDYHETKDRVVSRELRLQAGLTAHSRYSHEVIDAKDLAEASLPKPEKSEVDLPTVLLTHVPLYRTTGTPCGPLREKYPPSKPSAGQTEPLAYDEPNAIRVARGYQYQNVLDPSVSKDITDKIGNVAWAFSGDDHDYCEVVHRSYASAGGGIREITVKSISFAMGVRHPGFVMASLWNPIDSKGNSVAKKEDAGATMQTKLCLLPDELAIFIWYGIYAALSLGLITLYAIKLARHDGESAVTGGQGSVLPVAQLHSQSSAEAEKAAEYRSRSNSNALSSSTANGSAQPHPSMAHAENNRLSSRTMAARTRSVSPNTGYGLPASQSKFNPPLINHAGYFEASPRSYGTRTAMATHEQRSTKLDRASTIMRKMYIPRPTRRGWKRVLWEFGRLFLRIGVVAFVWFFWLLRR